ncbi:MAG: YeeE/YedE thiosulfate transporter family protein [Gammaproteobacteria bacterium]|jgi:uncharacterized membrane protein YedE/YeeE
MDTWSTLFPVGVAHYLVGGLLIGAGVSVLFIFTGQVGGMSSLFSAVWSYVSRVPYFQQAQFTATRRWRLLYALGLIIGAAVWFMLFRPAAITTHIPWWQLALGGFIGGYGARLGNGCTSGHGICGLASLNAYSLLAVLVFMATAITTAHIVGALGGA